MNVVILRSLVAVIKWQAHLNLVYIHSSAAGTLLKARPVDCYEQIESKNVQELHQRSITRKEPLLLLQSSFGSSGICPGIYSVCHKIRPHFATTGNHLKITTFIL